jgi:glycosyltransferase involved in cell wall biosynthesis
MTGHCSHFICKNCEKWKTLCNNCPLKHSYPKSLIVDNSKRNYVLKQQLFTSIDDLTIVAVSKWLASLVKESFLKDIPVEVIYNGVDTDVFKPTLSSLKSDLYLSEKKVLLGVATAWSKDKGLYDYVKLSEVLGDEYKIVLIGLSDKQMEELPDAIHKVPKTTNLQQLAMYYSMADIVLNLSYAESFGLTTVEGMACGTPGIVYNRTASPELVSENTGLVVEAGNIDQLCVAINNISSREKQYYSLTCRNRVLELFDKTKNYNKYIDLYSSKI